MGKANGSGGNGVKKPPELFAGDAEHRFWLVNCHRRRGPPLGISDCAGGGEMGEGQMGMAATADIKPLCLRGNQLYKG